MHMLLLRPHIHAGQAYRAGEHLDLPNETARWLIAQGVATPVAPPKRPTPPTSSTDSIENTKP